MPDRDWTNLLPPSGWSHGLPAPPFVIGGMLSGPEIIKQVREGNIVIDPFDESMVGPNSLDVRLGSWIIQLDSEESAFDDGWDLTKPIPEGDIVNHVMGPKGFLMKKGVAYLAHTVESIWCRNFVPWLDARSTVGRYFLQCHMTAGRGDIGWKGTFTMEMMAVARSIRVYGGLPIAQVSFFSVQGDIKPYEGGYNNQTGPRLPKPLKLGIDLRGKDHKE